MKKIKYLLLNHNVEELHVLEQYLFQLIRFIETAEFKQDIKSDKQRKIFNELFNIEHSIQVIRGFCQDMDEEQYVAWQIPDTSQEDYHEVIYSFSSKEVLMLIFNIEEQMFNVVTDSEYCEPDDNGWFFMKMSEYKNQLDDVTAFDEHSIINHIKTHYGKEENTSKADGDV